MENLNTKLRTELSLNQWKNTASVIEWFKNINEKHLNKFIVFDIKEFYPSIKENILRNALNLPVILQQSVARTKKLYTTLGSPYYLTMEKHG